MEKRGASLEVAIAVGADPATLLSGVAPLPEGIDELAFAGFLRGAPTRMTKGRKIGMSVPADAEFVIEGIVNPGERRTEGPFGDHFGHYSHAAPFPVFHVREVTHRERPIFHASVVGKPPQEDKYMGEAVQEMFTGVLKVIHPEIVDLWAYFEAGFQNLLVVAVENRFAREGRKTALGLMGTGQLSLTKMIVLVDGDVNPRDRQAVFEAIAKHFDPAEDFMLIPGVPLDTLDFTSFTMNLGRMVIDAQSHGRPVGRVLARHRRAAVAVARARHRSARVRRAREGAPARVGRHARRAGGGDGRGVIENLFHRADYAHVKLIVTVSMDVPLRTTTCCCGASSRASTARATRSPRTPRIARRVAAVKGPLGIDVTWEGRLSRSGRHPRRDDREGGRLVGTRVTRTSRVALAAAFALGLLFSCGPRDSQTGRRAGRRLARARRVARRHDPARAARARRGRFARRHARRSALGVAGQPVGRVSYDSPRVHFVVTDSAGTLAFDGWLRRGLVVGALSGGPTGAETNHALLPQLSLKQAVKPAKPSPWPEGVVGGEPPIVPATQRSLAEWIAR